jgi:excisionase family DNA binding protein
MNLSKIETKLENIETLVRSLSLNTKTVLDLNELVIYTNLSKHYIYKLTSKKQIPYSTGNGKKIYFDRKEIDAWLLRNKQEVKRDSPKYSN